MTDQLSFGVVLLTEHPADGSATRHRDEVSETARLAESLGYDSLWVGEHHFTDRIYFDNFQMLSYLAADRFVLGTPEEVVEEIERYRETFEMDHLVLRSRWAGMPPEPARESLRLLAEEVIPHFE